MVVGSGSGCFNDLQGKSLVFLLCIQVRYKRFWPAGRVLDTTASVEAIFQGAILANDYQLPIKLSSG